MCSFYLQAMPHQAAAALSSLLTQPDLLGVIFGSLPTNTRLGSIPTVCKQFQEAARHCPPTAVTLRLESHLDAAYKARLFNSWVHQVDTRHITYLQVSYGSHISCYVSRPRAYGTDYLPPLPFAALRGLRSLDLHGPILTPYDAVHLQGLTSLRASQSCGSCAAMTVALLTNLQQLELVIHGDHNRHQQLTSIQAVADLASPWVELGNRLNKLTGLTLRIDPCMLGNAIVTMLSGLTSLQHLVLDDCTMTIEVLEEFGSGFGHLTRLGITFPTPPDSWSNSPPTSRLGSALDLVALSGLQQVNMVMHILIDIIQMLLWLCCGYVVQPACDVLMFNQEVYPARPARALLLHYIRRVAVKIASLVCILLSCWCSHHTCSTFGHFCCCCC